jgi:hypothetical protein
MIEQNTFKFSKLFHIHVMLTPKQRVTTFNVELRILVYKLRAVRILYVLRLSQLFRLGSSGYSCIFILVLPELFFILQPM